MVIQSIQKGHQSFAQNLDTPKGLKNAKISLRGDLSDSVSGKDSKSKKEISDVLSAKSLKAESKGIEKDFRSGLRDAKVSLRQDKGSAILHENLKAQIKINSESSSNTQKTQSVEKSISAPTFASEQNPGALKNYTTTSKYQATSDTTREASSSLVANSNEKSGGVTQKVNLDNQTDSKSSNHSELSRTNTANVSVGAYTKDGFSVRETNVDSKGEQLNSSKSASQTVTDKERIAITSQKGQPTVQSYSHQNIQSAANAYSEQSVYTEGKSNSTQAVKSESLQLGNLQLKRMEINSNSNSESLSFSDTTSHSENSVAVTNLGKNGEVLSKKETSSESDSSVQKDVETRASADSQRVISQLSDGKQSLSRDVTHSSSDLQQITEIASTTSKTNIDANGNSVFSGNNKVASSSTLNRHNDQEVIREVSRGPGGMDVSGSNTSSSNTKISTHIDSKKGLGVSSERDIERNIDTESKTQYVGSLKEKNENGTQTYNVSSLEVSKQRTEDSTREGDKTSTTVTEMEMAKKVKGEVSFTPGKPQANELSKGADVKSPQASVAVNFGSYNGMAGGFKFDSGEMNFDFSFHSAQVTDQETARSGQTGSVSSTSQTGQLNDARLTGKLTSSMNEAGEQVIEFKASYNRNGEKYSVSESGDKKSAAVGEQDTKAEISGKFVISKNGDVKNVSSEFDMFKSQSGDAKGTSEGAARSALDQNDPLRNMFSYDGKGVKANLGFASFNFAISA